MGNSNNGDRITAVTFVFKDDIKRQDLLCSIQSRVNDGWVFVVIDKGDRLISWKENGDWVEATVQDANGNYRIVKCKYPGLWG